MYVSWKVRRLRAAVPFPIRGGNRVANADYEAVWTAARAWATQKGLHVEDAGIQGAPPI